MAAQDYYEWLSASVARYETLSRSLIKHNAEKGRVVEGVVKATLRSILPGRFSLGTGFVVTASGQISPQLDIVIYDGFHNAPMILEGGVGVFPIECVYAFVEVKSCLDGDEIVGIADAIGKVRSFAAEKKYVVYGAGGPPDKPVSVALELNNDLPPRSYVFSLRSKLSTDTLLQALKDKTEQAEAHVHGLAVIEPSVFVSQRAKYTKPYEFDSMSGKALAHFGMSVLHGVQSFPMQPAAMDKYLRQ